MLRVYATRKAIKGARALGIEEDVAALVRVMILAGSVDRDRDRFLDPAAFIVAGDGWLARIEKRPRPFGPGKYWSVVSIEPHRGGPIRPRADTRAEAAEYLTEEFPAAFSVTIGGERFEFEWSHATAG